ncbi:MAG: hypothetical protein ACFFG0_15375 [Candidatus Thorarchaeota archaeon]
MNRDEIKGLIKWMREKQDGINKKCPYSKCYICLSTIIETPGKELIEITSPFSVNLRSGNTIGRDAKTGEYKESYMW